MRKLVAKIVLGCIFAFAIFFSVEINHESTDSGTSLTMLNSEALAGGDFYCSTFCKDLPGDVCIMCPCGDIMWDANEFGATYPVLPC